MPITKPKERSKEDLLQEITELKMMVSQLQIAQTHPFEAEHQTATELQKLVDESSHDLIFIHDLDGRILAMNKVVTDFLPNKKITDMRDMLVPKVRDKFDVYLSRIKANGSDKGYMKVYDREGEERILKYNNKLVQDPDLGSAVQCLAHDITELWVANKKLKASELSYKGLFDSSDDAIFILNEKGHIISANKTAQEIYHKDETNLIGKNYARVAMRNIQDSLKLSYKLRRTWNGNLQKLEVSGKLANGLPYTKEVAFKKGKYFAEEVILCHERDITERKLAEAKIRDEVALKKTEEKLHKVFEKVNLMALIIDSNEKITYCNIALAKLIGSKPNDVTGKKPAQLFTLDRQYKKGEFFSEMVNGGFINKFEWKLNSKYGDERTIQFTVTLMTSPNGEIVALTMLGEDVTENKRMVRALRESNEKLKDLFENASDLIVVFDADGKISYANQSWKSALGYTDQDLAKLKFEDLLADDSKEAASEYLRKVVLGEKIDNLETKFVTNTNKPIYVVGSVNCKIQNGKVLEFRGIFYDNTYKVRAERTQYLYYGIANLALKSDNLDTLFIDIHKLMKSVMEVNNFHVALFDKGKNSLQYPYYVDEQFGIYNGIEKQKTILSDSLTEYTLRYANSIFLYEEHIIQLASKGELQITGRIPKIWMGVPLKLDGDIIGVIGVKSYNDKGKYRLRHLEMLDFVSGQIAFAIERKRKEEMIRNQTAKLNAIFEASTHLIWTVTKGRVLTSFNKNYSEAVFKQYGIRPAIGLTVTKNIPILAGQEYINYINKKYEGAFNGIPQHLETKIQGADGVDYWWDTFLNPIFEPDGSIEEVSIISQNITEKKRSELTMQESEEKFRNIFESFQDIYYRTDIQGNILLISPSIYEICGFKPTELIGKNISNFYSNPKKQERLIKQLLKTGSVRNYEVDIQRKDGSYINCISHLRLIYGRDLEPVAVIGVARDITELKKSSEELLKAKELAERSLKVKDVFLANMSHEIRTPMNGVIGMIDLLADSQLDVKQQEYVQTIKKSSETLLEILNDILDLSKLEAGKMELRLSPISLQHTIEKLHALFKQQASNKDIELLYEIDPNTPLQLLADETRLLQILSNLTSNSIKFTDRGHVKVYVKPVLSSGNEHLIKVEVQDTGIGISEENMLKLFATFQQLDNSSTKTYQGTGLGLAISKQLAQLMQGEVGVNSEVGKGSTFWFTFTAKESGVVVQKSVTQETKMFKFTGYKPYILLVDDNHINQKVASEILRHAGCRVEVVSDGQSAINKVVESPAYDMVLMDVQMPIMDGITATKLIKKLDMKRIPPVIAMTAYSMREDKEKFIGSGMDDYVSKPIRADLLLSKVKEWVEKSHPDMADMSVQSYSENFTDHSSTNAAENVPILDQSIVDSLRRIGGEDLVQETYAEFIPESMEQANISLRAAHSHDHEAIRRELHTLKGNAGTLGVLKISKLAEKIEKGLKQGNADHLIENVEELLVLCQEFKNHYEQHIKHN
jgi:PAS domain S-box-containing protein